MSTLFKTKSVDQILKESQAEGKTLQKVLGPFDVTMIGIGAIIGAGIFATIGEGVMGGIGGSAAGPSLMISFLITAIVCGFTALCYAEFAAMVPISGSAYTYGYATMGEMVAWILGWDLVIEYVIGNVALAISWAGYFNDLVFSISGFEIPIWLRIDYRSFVHQGLDISTVPHIFGIPMVINVVAIIMVAMITWLLVIGMEESSKFNDFMVVAKIVILLFFVGVGFYYFNIDNWKPFAPTGWKGIRIGAASIFFAYIGFDAVSTVAEETKNPKRDMPLGIIGSLVVCAVIYILVTAALTGMMPYSKLTCADMTEPLSAALKYNHASRWIIGLISLGALASTTAAFMVFQMGQPRIFFSMSRDGLLPDSFARVHPKYKTPHVTTIWMGVVVALLCGVANISEMANLCNLGTLFAFVLVAVGLIIIRIKDPSRPRPFKAPGGMLMPILSIVCCCGLMLSIEKNIWLMFFGWTGFGLIIYFLYSVKHSTLKEQVPAK